LIASSKSPINAIIIYNNFGRNKGGFVFFDKKMPSSVLKMAFPIGVSKND